MGSALGEWLSSGLAAKWGCVQGLSTGREAGEAAAEERNAVLRPWGREALVVPAAGCPVYERPGRGLTADSGLKGPALARDPRGKVLLRPDGSVS